MIPIDYWVVQIENIFHPQFDGQDRRAMIKKLLEEIIKNNESGS